MRRIIALVLTACGNGHEYVDDRLHAEVQDWQITSSPVPKTPISVRLDVRLANGSVPGTLTGADLIFGSPCVDGGRGCDGTLESIVAGVPLLIPSSLDRRFEAYETSCTTFLVDPAYAPESLGNGPLRCGAQIVAMLALRGSWNFGPDTQAQATLMVRCP